VSEVASNGELRGGKLTPYQGGIRVAAAVRWPETGISGGKESEERMGYIDVFPTLMAVAEYDKNPKNDLDGINMLNGIKGERLGDRSWFTYEDQSNNKIEKLAINKDEWKLVVHRTAPDADKISLKNELFRITDDPNEEVDVASQNSLKLEELLSELNTFYNLKSDNQIPRYSARDDYIEPVLIPNWQPIK
jgi:arylsulfatase A-like enzyme